MFMSLSLSLSLLPLLITPPFPHYSSVLHMNCLVIRKCFDYPNSILTTLSINFHTTSKLRTCLVVIFENIPKKTRGTKTTQRKYLVFFFLFEKHEKQENTKNMFDLCFLKLFYVLKHKKTK